MELNLNTCFNKNQIAYMAREVERQKAEPTFINGMVDGMEFISNFSQDMLNFSVLFDLNELVVCRSRNRGYRVTPATFQNGGSSARADTIPDAMERLLNHAPFVKEDILDDWIKQFLWVHPFEDGNGRTASILRNWFLGTLGNPTDLPHYEW